MNLADEQTKSKFNQQFKTVTYFDPADISSSVGRCCGLEIWNKLERITLNVVQLS